VRFRIGAAMENTFLSTPHQSASLTASPPGEAFGAATKQNDKLKFAYPKRVSFLLCGAK